MTNKLLSYTQVNGIILCKSGLRIGASPETTEIGGLDNPVIKHPITNMPFIPGSSLKGKLRSLLETHYSAFEKDGSPSRGDTKDRKALKIASFFGPHMNTKHNLGPSRLICRDANLTAEFAQLYKRRYDELGLDFLEIKTETSINRNNNTANSGSLRTIERVPQGTEFSFSFITRNYNWGDFDPNESSTNLELLFEGMELLEQDYLGGYGSRGSGHIQFLNVTVNGQVNNRFEVRT